MIKIIKHGHPYEIKKRYFQVTCERCGCMFECGKDDMRIMAGDPLLKNFIFEVSCPDCDQNIHTTTVASNIKERTETITVNISEEDSNG